MFSSRKLWPFATLAYLALPLQACLAVDCSVYINASLSGGGGLSLVAKDYLHLTETIPGGSTIDCIGTDDKQPHGPYAFTCHSRESKRSYDTTVNYFYAPHPRTSHSSLGSIYFDGAIWYSECDTSLKPYTLDKPFDPFSK